MKHRKAEDRKEELEKYRKELVKDIEQWQYINEHGCNDPHWTDGDNMNLVRNHIIHDKQIIFAVCEETGEPLPEEYYLATPPEVSSKYMNNLKQKSRVERLAFTNGRLETKKTKYNPTQLSLF